MAQQEQGERDPSQVNYETVFTNAKAGMEGVDAERVKRVVYEASKGSAHYENEQRKERAHEDRIAHMRVIQRQLSPADLARHTAAMDIKLAALEAGRDMSRTWLHIDMDAFFAAVEELERPELRNRPFAVGSIGMISTANYAARKFGVRSAMPGFIATKLCPELLFVPGDYEKYRAASERTRALFRDYDPDLQPGSLDEAALDVTDYCAARGVHAAAVAAEIRERVRRETGLTCSVGIAPNRMLAKICSDRNKPDGQFQLEGRRQVVMDFMRDLGIRKVPGVGKVTQRLLAALDVHTCADLFTHRGLLQALFSTVSCDFFARVALGLGPTQHEVPPVEGEVGRKGISHERTFRPLSRRGDLEAKLRELVVALAEDMEGEGLRGRTVTLKLKLSTFELRTRAITLPHHICTAEDLFAAGQRLLLAELPCELRLLGLRVSNFHEAARREPGQRSIEEMLASRQPGGGQEQQQAGELISATLRDQQGTSGGVEDADSSGMVHTSQVLPDGDIFELTLRDWEPHGSAEDGASLELSLQEWQEGGSGGGSMHNGCNSVAWPGPADAANGDSGDYSLPPSLLVSPTTTVRFEREAAAEPEAEAGGELAAPAATAAADSAAEPGSLSLHMPATRLDLMLQQAAGWLVAHTGTYRQAEEHRPDERRRGQVPTWSCSACTFDNPRAAFWCEVCSNSRLSLRPAPAAADNSAPGSGERGSGSNRKDGGGTSSSKAKRGKKAAAGAGAAGARGPSILRFMSAAQQQTSTAEEQLQQPVPEGPRQEQQQQPADRGEVTAHGGQQQPLLLLHPQQEQQAVQQEQKQQASLPSSQEDEYEEHTGPPESPLLPGEDVMECIVCGQWIRETRLQAHEAVHKDESLARKLQQEEDKLNRLFANASSTAIGSGSGGRGGSSGKKRQAAGMAGGGGAGRQGTLAAAFGKRFKQ